MFTPTQHTFLVAKKLVNLEEPELMFQVRRFMSERDVSIAQSAFRQVLERTSLNIAWMGDYFSLIREVLREQSHHLHENNP